MRRSSLDSDGLAREGAVSLERLQAPLRAGEVILDFYLGPEKAYASVVGLDGWHIVHLHDVVPGELMRLIRKRFSPRVALATSYEYLADSMSQLGQMLFPTSLLRYLENARRIFLVPSGPLWRVPFAWLCVGGKRLFERWQVCNVPAARFAGSSTSISPRPGRSGYVGGFDAPPESDRLDSVDAELTYVAGKLHCEPDANATPSRVLQAMAEADIIHLACHGDYDELSPLLSCLRLREDDLHVDGRLYLVELLRSGVGASVVNLAACHTAEMGSSMTLPETLAHVVLGAGARFVVASLWQANDEQCQLFSGYFYSAMLDDKGKDPIDAFHAAQIRQFGESKALADAYGWSPDQQMVFLANLVMIGATSDHAS